MTTQSNMAIVGIIDDDTIHKVSSIWSEFRDTFGVKGFSNIPYPHISLQVAQHYEVDQLESSLRTTARQLSRIELYTGGLGIFTGKAPVVHVAVARTTQFDNLQEQMHSICRQWAKNPDEHYNPDRWIPHITLAQGQIVNDQIPQMIRMLQHRDLQWTIHIEALAVMRYSQDKPQKTFPFKGV